MKKLVSLLLASLMLTMNVLAVVSVNPGGGSTSPGSGHGTGSPWSTSTNADKGPGMLIHVEKIPVAINKDGKGYGNTVRYFTEHFPRTNVDDGLEGIWLLPSRDIDKTHYAIKAGPSPEGYLYNREPINCGYFMAGNESNITNHIGADAFNEAQKVTEANPSNSLPQGYWAGVIAGLPKMVCATIVVQLFSPNDMYNGYIDSEDIGLVNTAVNNYLGFTPESTNNPFVRKSEEYELRAFVNHCGLIATVIAAMEPSESRNSLIRDLEEMSTNYFSGSSYEPMVVTGEMIVASEYNNNMTMTHWWTPKRCLDSVVGGSWRNFDRTTSQAHIDSVSGSGYNASAGGLNMFGRPTGNGWKQWSGGITIFHIP